MYMSSGFQDDYKFFTSYFVRSNSPFFNKIKGTGTIAKATKPRRLFPHPKPSALYILNPINGSRAPAADLTTVFAARALVVELGLLVTT